MCVLKILAASAAGIAILLIKRYLTRATFKSNASMIGKTVVITGANCGIGKATAIELAKRKSRVILACRDVNKGRDAVRDIRKYTNLGELIVKHLDLASLKSVRLFSEDIIKEETKIDVLINNAGVMGCPFSKTEDGFETQMGVNHLGHFLLTNLLLDTLKKSSPSRIVIVSSGLYKRGVIDLDNLNYEKDEATYRGTKGYANSKLANNLFARELSKRLEETDVGVHCLHPGMVLTNLGRHAFPMIIQWMLYPLARLLVKTPWEGCQTVLYCSAAEELEGVSGRYYGNCKEEPWTEKSEDDELAKKLWDVSARLTNL